MRLFIAKTLWRMEYFLRDLRRGLLYRYPPCCTLQFALGTALRVQHQALRRGCVVTDDNKWVPCIYHKKRHPQWEPVTRPQLPKKGPLGRIFRRLEAMLSS